jgi:hypothetical protein
VGVCLISLVASKADKGKRKLQQLPMVLKPKIGEVILTGTKSKNMVTGFASRPMPAAGSGASSGTEAEVIIS